MAITTYRPSQPTPVDMAQAGGAATDPYAQIAQQLQEQLSLSEGMRQARINYASPQGMGGQAVQTLANPTNRAEGQSPVQGLSAGSSLNDSFASEISKAGDNSTNILNTLVTLLNTKKTNERADKADSRAERELKLKEAEASNKGVKVDDLLATRKALVDQGLDTSAVDQQLTTKGIDINQTTKSKATQEIVEIIDKLLSADTKPMTGTLQIGAMIPGTKTQNTLNEFNKLKAKLSLDNVKSLKGQGAISNEERRLLENASSSIGRNTSDTDFKQQLQELRDGLVGEVSGGVPTQVRLKSPDGQTYDVPQSEVQDALDHGYKRI